MNLLSLLEKAKKENINQVFIFYKDENGDIDNICFQNNVFFRLEPNRKIRFLNPIRTVDKLNEIKQGKLKIVGMGRYGKKINFKKEYNYYSCIGRLG